MKIIPVFIVAAVVMVIFAGCDNSTVKKISDSDVFVSGDQEILVQDSDTANTDSDTIKKDDDSAAADVDNIAIDQDNAASDEESDVFIPDNITDDWQNEVIISDTDNLKPDNDVQAVFSEVTYNFSSGISYNLIGKTTIRYAGMGDIIFGTPSEYNADTNSVSIVFYQDISIPEKQEYVEFIISKKTNKLSSCSDSKPCNVELGKNENSATHYIAGMNGNPIANGILTGFLSVGMFLETSSEARSLNFNSKKLTYTPVN